MIFSIYTCTESSPSLKNLNSVFKDTTVGVHVGERPSLIPSPVAWEWGWTEAQLHWPNLVPRMWSCEYVYMHGACCPPAQLQCSRSRSGEPGNEANIDQHLGLCDFRFGQKVEVQRHEGDRILFFSNVHISQQSTVLQWSSVIYMFGSLAVNSCFQHCTGNCNFYHKFLWSSVNIKSTCTRINWVLVTFSIV